MVNRRSSWVSLSIVFSFTSDIIRNIAETLNRLFSCVYRKEGSHSREGMAQTCQDIFVKRLISWCRTRQDSVGAGVCDGLVRRYWVQSLRVRILEQCANVPHNLPLSNGLCLYSQFTSLMIMLGPLDQWCSGVHVRCLFSSQPCSCVFSGVWTSRHVGISNPAAPRTCRTSRRFGRQKAFQEFRPRSGTIWFAGHIDCVETPFRSEGGGGWSTTSGFPKRCHSCWPTEFFVLSNNQHLLIIMWMKGTWWWFRYHEPRAGTTIWALVAVVYSSGRTCERWLSYLQPKHLFQIYFIVVVAEG